MPSPPEAGDVPPEERPPEERPPRGEPAPGSPGQRAPGGEPAPGSPEPRTPGGGPPPASPEPRTPGGGPPPGSPEEALRRLEQRLDRASEAAERLMAQVAREAVRPAQPPGAGDPTTGGAGNPPSGAGDPTGGAGDPTGGAGKPPPGPGDPTGGATGGTPPNPPPAGWQSAEDGARSSTPELDPFVALVQAVRDLIPPDLQERLIAALREVLMALRALIDWYLERLDRRREHGIEVQDIPIL
jgi:ESX secretion-associated protein EspI